MVLTVLSNAAWVLLERWEALTPEEREVFPPICPEFVVELRSPSDSLKAAQFKMQEYMANGARLGWLINPKNQQVEIYRQAREKEREVPSGGSLRSELRKRGTASTY